MSPVESTLAGRADSLFPSLIRRKSLTGYFQAVGTNQDERFRHEARVLDDFRRSTQAA